jgi:hypothetical protein
MIDIQSQRKSAVDVMRAPPPVDGKLAALDALDRLGFNPSGWFPDRVLTAVTDARIAIITDRFSEARRALEEARQATDTFIEVLKAGPLAEVEVSREEALARAQDELQQFLLVLDWVKSKDESGK